MDKKTQESDIKGMIIEKYYQTKIYIIFE